MNSPILPVEVWRNIFAGITIREAHTFAASSEEAACIFANVQGITLEEYQALEVGLTYSNSPEAVHFSDQWATLDVDGIVVMRLADQHWQSYCLYQVMSKSRCTNPNHIHKNDKDPLRYTYAQSKSWGDARKTYQVSCSYELNLVKRTVECTQPARITLNVIVNLSHAHAKVLILTGREEKGPVTATSWKELFIQNNVWVRFFKTSKANKIENHV